MPPRHPPRREPRVLAVTLVGPQRLAWAVVDPWEFRGAGLIRARAAGRALALRRLVRREHPTAVLAEPALATDLTRGLARLAVPGTTARVPQPPLGVARELYPELDIYAPTAPLRRAAILALAAVLHGELPRRTYATPRHRALPRAP